MKRRVVSLATVLALLGPGAFAAPQEVAADSCMPVWADVLTLGLTAIVDAANPCAPFSGPWQCDITNVAATASDFQGSFYMAHGYTYDFAGQCANTHVSAGFSETSKTGKETLVGPRATITAAWACPSDPWIVAPGQTPPTCTLISANVQGAASAAQEVVNTNFPLSSGVLSDASRQALIGQLHNALQLQPTPTPIPATPTAPPSPSTPVPYRDPTIVDGWPRLEDRVQGEAVRSLQYLLQAHDLTLPDASVDGLFGFGTTAAVRKFQQAQGLAADGIVGPLTWQALLVDVQQDAQGPAVAAVQHQLLARGVVIVVDGNFGPDTDAAVRGYQQSRGLTVDGDVGPQTWQSLLSGK